MKGFKEGSVDSNTDCLLTNFPVGCSSGSPFPGLMHRVRLHLIPVSPSRCAPRPTSAFQLSESLTFRCRSHLCYLRLLSPHPEDLTLPHSTRTHISNLGAKIFTHPSLMKTQCHLRKTNLCRRTIGGLGQNKWTWSILPKNTDDESSSSLCWRGCRDPLSGCLNPGFYCCDKPLCWKTT